MTVQRRIAWSLWALGVMLAVFAIPSAPSASTGVYGLVLMAVSPVITGLGALIVSRGVASRIGWLFVAFPLTVVAGLALQRYGGWWDAVPLGEAAAWLSQWLSTPAVLGVAIFLPLLFPTGRLVSARWRVPAGLGMAAIVLLSAGEALRPQTLDVRGSHPNPLSADATAIDLLLIAALPLLLIALVAGIDSIVVRLRRSRGVERQQLKWFAFAAAFVPLGLTITVLDAVLLVGSGADEATAVGEAGWIISFLALAVGVPLAAATAILRHRLYDIDVVINRALVYGALTATLAGAYLGGVLLFGLVVRPLTGSSNLAIAGSTLAVAALFGPARAWIQRVVDRRFYRRRYDAARTLASFGARLRDEVDLDALAADLRAVVGETLQPAHVSLWLRRAER